MKRGQIRTLKRQKIQCSDALPALKRCRLTVATLRWAIQRSDPLRNKAQPNQNVETQKKFNVLMPSAMKRSESER